MLIKITRGRRHSVVAHVEETASGVKLLKITPDKGVMPDIAGIPDMYPDVKSLRRAVEAAMKAASNPVVSLDRVMLSATAFKQWHETALAAAKKYAASVQPEAVPDEQVRQISCGRLLIWVALPNGEEVSLIVPASEWTWVN